MINSSDYDFIVPEFVASASPDKFNPNMTGAVVVSGLRIDNPAAAWVAGAEIRKRASDFDMSAIRMIKQACSLFNIADSMFDVPPVSGVVVSDGEHTAEFTVFDDNSLNKAASDLLSKRGRLPYPFAHDCAVALQEEARKQRLRFSEDTAVGIRKLAGDYNVDFKAGKELLDSAVSRAESAGMTQHAEILRKIAGMCTEDCSPEFAPYFITALDEFNRAFGELKKEASADTRYPEDVFYMTTAEYTKRLASSDVPIAGKHMTSGDIRGRSDAIRKWASVCGYSIPANANATDIGAVVNGMPAALQEEFVELFS